MGLFQLANTMRLIRNHPAMPFWKGATRHLAWQARKLAGRFPCEIPLGDSRLLVAGRRVARGPAALVNCMELYDHNNMGLLRQILHEGLARRVFDIGANIGVYTLLLSENPEVEVAAFEPHPVTYRMLQENIRHNGRANATGWQLALSDRGGVLNFSDVPGSPVNHVVGGTGELQQERSDCTTAPGKDERQPTLRVESVRGDDFCQLHGFQPEVIKLDVEGHEPAVLAGLTETLRHVGLIVVETEGREQPVDRILCQARLSGPWACDFNHQRFNPHTSHAEDPIYLSNDFRERLESLGYRFAD